MLRPLNQLDIVQSWNSMWLPWLPFQLWLKHSCEAAEGAWRPPSLFGLGGAYCADSRMDYSFLAEHEEAELP